MHRDAALPQKGPGSGGAVEERYVYRCLICFRFSKPSMNSAKTQHTIKMIAIDVTVQFMSLSSIVMPPDDLLLSSGWQGVQQGFPHHARPLK
jgi:hypothetical protein